MNNVKVSQPQYFKKFACTCDKCVYNCCRHNWQIRIDKNTYDKYVRLDNDVGKAFLEKIKVISENPFIAVIVASSDGSCHFLDEKGFCSIQLKLGYDYLSRTCRIHPRSISYIAGEFETFLELSCEEAVKVALFNEEPMMLEESILEPDGSGNVIPNRMLETEKYTSAPNAVELFMKLRMTSTVIIQSRQYNIRVRMLLLCLFIEQASTLLTSGRDFELGRHIDENLKLMSTGVYDNLAGQMPGGIENDFDLCLDILRDMASKGDRRFNKILEQALEGLGISGNGSDDTLSRDSLPDEFREDYINYYNLYFADKEYIFENYIVNHILMEGFPFNYGRGAVVMANYADLLAKLNLIELLLVGVCKHRGAFDEWSIIDCVSAFSRCYDHALKGYLMME